MTSDVPSGPRPHTPAGALAVERRCTLVRVLAGVLVALIVAECAMRPFSTALSNSWRPVVEDDPLEESSKEIRQYFEGIAASHFSSSHARLTGHPWLKDAPVLVLVGDSYVEALHVGDTETLGAQIEQRARGSGHPLNVRQYGWSGASAADYRAAATHIARRWGGAPVLILVNQGDLGRAAFTGATKFVIQVDRTVHVETGDELATIRPDGFADWILRRSTLAYVAGRRFLELRSTSSPIVNASEFTSQLGSEAEMVRISMRELRRAYGDTLLLVYVPEIPIDGTTSDRSAEKMFLETCDTVHVACLSEASPLLAVTATSRFVRGFPNTRPGFGHINSFGYSLIAEDVWRRTSLLRKVAH